MIENATREAMADVMIPLFTGKPRRRRSRVGGAKPTEKQVWAGIDRLAAFAPDRVRQH